MVYPVENSQTTAQTTTPGHIVGESRRAPWRWLLKAPVLKEFWRYFLPFILIAIPAFVYVEHLLLDIERGEAKTRLAAQTQNAKASLSRDLKALVSDVRILMDSESLQTYFQQADPRTRFELEQRVLRFVEDRGIYDQINILDADGHERIRVDASPTGAHLIPSDRLQDQSDLYAIQHAAALGPGEIYVGPLDLIVENGRIETPQVPTIRLAVPIYANRERIQGFLVLNYRAQAMLNHVQDAITQKGVQAHLINTAGFWLLAPERDKAWGFLMEDGPSFAETYPEVWARVQSTTHGQFLTQAGLVTYETLIPNIDIGTDVALPADMDRIGTIITVMPLSNLGLFTDPRQRFIQFAAFALILALGAVGSYLIARTRIREKSALAAMEAARDEAEIANTAKSDFLATMSHELRTPLNAILGYTQMLTFYQGGTLDDTQREYVDTILHGGHHLLDLVNSILDVNRMESEQLPIHIERVTANGVVAKSLDLMHAIAEKKGVTIKDRFGPTRPVLVMTDPHRLKQCVLNLVSNAIKFTPPGGTVTVYGRVGDDGFLRIMVSDTGVGIAPKDQDAVFTLFNRLDADPMVTQDGVGIGLSVTKMLIERMGGHVDFESLEDHGSTFWLAVPLSHNDQVVIWTPELSVGIDALDRDHQIFARLINKLAQPDLSSRATDLTVLQLNEFAHEHFAREEAVMEACACAPAQDHATHHQTTADHLETLTRTWQSSRDRVMIERLHAYLKDMWLDDIMEFDTDLAETVHQQGINVTKVLRQRKLVDVT